MLLLCVVNSCAVYRAAKCRELDGTRVKRVNFANFQRSMLANNLATKDASMAVWRNVCLYTGIVTPEQHHNTVQNTTTATR